MLTALRLRPKVRIYFFWEWPPNNVMFNYLRHAPTGIIHSSFRDAPTVVLHWIRLCVPLSRA